MMSDAASIIQSGNLYMFTMHNPVRWRDPSGRAAIPFVQSAGQALWDFFTIVVGGWMIGEALTSNNNNSRSAQGGGTVMVGGEIVAGAGFVAGGGTAVVGAGTTTWLSPGAFAGDFAGQAGVLPGVLGWSMSVPQTQRLSRNEAAVYVEELRSQGLTPIFRGGFYGLDNHFEI